MKVALLGYGRMGREIEAVAGTRGHSIVSKFSSKTPLTHPNDLRDADVAIDFSRADCVERHASLCAEASVPLVIGTTGWSDTLEQVRAIITNAGGRCVYGPNFSLGVNVFYHIVRRAGELFNKLPQYDLAVNEVHHTKKLDSPSGTALAIGNILTSTVTRKERVVAFDPHRKNSPSELLISSLRVGAVPGTHSVMFDSLTDTIELTHSARNRGGFAVGALEAAHWIVKHKGFYTVEQFTESLLAGEEI